MPNYYKKYIKYKKKYLHLRKTEIQTGGKVNTIELNDKISYLNIENNSDKTSITDICKNNNIKCKNNNIKCKNNYFDRCSYPNF